MRKKLLTSLVIGIGMVLPIILVNFLFFREAVTIFNSVNLIAAFLAAFPALLTLFLERRRIKIIEENFSIFLRDFVEAVRGGMTIPLALKHISVNDYGPLSPYVRRASAHLDWGIPLHKALTEFARATKSSLIARTIASVIETHAYGGRLTDVLEALSGTVVEIKKLRAERKLFVQSQLITGYIIFFVFLGVMIGIELFLFPSLESAQIGGAAIPGLTTGGPTTTKEVVEELKVMMRHLIIIQGIFAGLMVGKMSEGEMVAGLKHSLFMGLAGFLISLFVG